MSPDGSAGRRRTDRAPAKSKTEIRKRLEQQTTLLEAMAIVSSTLDLPTVLTRIAEQMCISIDATSAYIARYDQESNTSSTLAEYVGPEARPEERVTDFGQIYEETDTEFLAAMQANQCYIQHVDDPDLPEIDRAYMLQYGAQSILYVPLWIREQALGYAEVWDSQRRREFTPKEIALCQGIAQSAAIAIENARLYDAAQQELVERKRAEEALAEAKDELEAIVEKRTSELRIAVEELRQEIAERKRAEGALRESEAEIGKRLEEQTILREAMAVISSTLDLPSVLERIAEQMCISIDATSAYINTFDPETKKTTVLAEYFGPEACSRERVSDLGETYEESDSWFMASLQANQHHIDHRDDPKLPQTDQVLMLQYGAQSILYIPLWIRDELIGYAELWEGRRRRDFTPEEIALCQGIAQSAAIAIENARLHQVAQQELEERKRAEEGLRGHAQKLETLRRIALELAAQSDLDDLLYSIASRAVEWLEGTAGGFYLYRPEQDALEWVVAVGANLAPIGTIRRRGEGLSGKVWEAGKPLIVNDYRHWNGNAATYEGHPWTAVIGVPVRWGEHFLGVLDVAADTPRSFSPADAELLALFASHAAIAIENVRLYAQQQRKLTEMTALYDTSLDIVSQLELSKVLRSITERATSLLGAAAAAVFLYHPENEELELVVDYNQPKDFAGSKLRLGEGLSGKVVQLGEPVMVEDYRHWDGRSQQYDSIHIGGMIGVPLKWGGGIIGVINVSEREKPRLFQDEDLSLLTLFANQAAVAIENARLYEETERLAATDALTGLWNRRHIWGRLETEMARARRSEHALSVLVMDIEDLKLFNDTYGHAAGDEVICAVAQLIINSCRKIDIVGRYGGDEFAVILPETGPQGAAEVAGRILAALEQQTFEAPEGTRVPIGISIGAASYPSDSDDVDGLLSVADAAMYSAKVAGGGQFASLGVGPKGLSEGSVASFDVLKGLLITVDSKDHYTSKHSQEVTQRALVLARALGMSEEEMRPLEIAGQLHDVGKIGVRTDILRKPGALTPDEWKMIYQHPRLGHMLLNQVPADENTLQAVLHHHERYDGKGYPDGLKREEIPLLARILAVADAFSAMVTDRPYRKALKLREAVDELRRNSGKQFDPQLAEKFIELVEKGEIE